jgi:hypothetical protein
VWLSTERRKIPCVAEGQISKRLERAVMTIPETPHDDYEDLVEYLENEPQPLPPRDPIGPPDVQPGEVPIKLDE